MLKWSSYFQTPAFLEYTRAHMIPDDLKSTILKQCRISPGSRVLDIGCGTGYLARLLKEADASLQITGVDTDDDFLSRAEELSPDITFIRADALSLPFKDNSFDAVVSHTFFTSISEPGQALDEMRRICTPQGSVSAVVSMTFQPAVCPGFYPKDLPWLDEYNELHHKMWTMFETINPMKEYLGALSPEALPHFLAAGGLKEITAYPIGRMFSLSNAALSPSDREQYLRLRERAEREKLNAYLEFEAAQRLFSREMGDRYLELLQQKFQFYRDHPQENQIWEWEGGASILLCGKNT